MTAVPNNNSKIQIESIRFRGAASEGTMQAIGGAINQLFDDRDTEITNRTAADANLQSQINSTNSALSTLTGRVNNATKAYVQGDFTWIENPTGGAPVMGQYTMTADRGTWCLEFFTGGPYTGGGSGSPSAYVRTLKLDTGLGTSGVSWPIMYVQASFANLFFRVQIFKADSV